MSAANAPSELAKHLAALRAEQAAKRRRLYPQTEISELTALARLAESLWGDGRRSAPGPHGWGGFVEFDRDVIRAGRMGVWRIGYYLSPPLPNGFEPARRRRHMFQGASYREIFDQVLLWKRRRA